MQRAAKWNTNETVFISRLTLKFEGNSFAPGVPDERILRLIQEMQLLLINKETFPMFPVSPGFSRVCIFVKLAHYGPVSAIFTFTDNHASLAE